MCFDVFNKHVHTYIRTRICTYAQKYTCMSIICIYIYIYMRIYIYIYIQCISYVSITYIYIYIHIYGGVSFVCGSELMKLGAVKCLSGMSVWTIQIHSQNEDDEFLYGKYMDFQECMNGHDGFSVRILHIRNGKRHLV